MGYSGCSGSAKTYQNLTNLQDYLVDDCFYVDDDWLAWAFHQLHTNVRTVDSSKHWSFCCKSIDDHEPWFELQHNTNRTLLQKNCSEKLKGFEKFMV